MGRHSMNKLTRKGFTHVCYNSLCNNMLPEHRYIRQSYQVSRFWFCVECLKSPTSQAMHYKCGREDCNNQVDMNTRVYRKYCSILCRKRDSCGVGLLTTGVCKVCNKEYSTRWSCRQKYCSDSCRQMVINVKNRMTHAVLKGKVYRPRSDNTRRIMEEFV